MSSGSSSNSSYSRGPAPAPICRCGIRAPLKTAFTEENAGRRFYGCALFERDRGKCCGFFKWLDGSTDENLRALLYSTMREKEEYKRKLRLCIAERGEFLCQLSSVEAFVKVVEKELMETRKAKEVVEEQLSRHRLLVWRIKQCSVCVVLLVAVILYKFYVTI